MYVKIKLTDEPSWPMCILDLSKQPAKGTAQNTERLNVNGAAFLWNEMAPWRNGKFVQLNSAFQIFFLIAKTILSCKVERKRFPM